MHISDVEKYRAEKEHQQRHGHLSKKYRDETAYHRSFPDKMDKNYHSPEANGEDENGYTP